MTETRSQNFTAIHRSSVKFCGGICRFKTFSTRILLARKTFLRFTCSSIQVKMRVLLTYFARILLAICGRIFVYESHSPLTYVVF